MLHESTSSIINFKAIFRNPRAADGRGLLEVTKTILVTIQIACQAKQFTAFSIYEASNDMTLILAVTRDGNSRFFSQFELFRRFLAWFAYKIQSGFFDLRF